MTERVVRIPQLYQARWWLRVIRTVLLLLAAVLVVGIVDRPEAGLLVLLPVLVWAVRTVGRRPVRLDPAAGSLTFPYRWLGRRRVTLADDVALLDDGRQSLVLQVGADTRNRVPILRWTGQVRRSQRPDVLDALAAALDRHAPRSAPVADRLRAQAAFLAAGGRLLDSPLIGSVRYSDRWTGVGSGVSDLLDTLLPFR
jgi:hypothetical protein